MEKETVTYTPTMNLRFCEREVKLSPFYVPDVSRVHVLQQQFEGSDGSTLWVDVPLVVEPPTTS